MLSISRFLCSSQSANLRGWSSLAVANRAIPLTSLSILVAYFHVPLYHAINIQQRLCFPIPGVYQTFFGIWNLIVFSVGPPTLMLLFGLFTIRHIRQSVSRIAPMNAQTSTQATALPKHRKRTDRQLIRMLLVQCVVFTVTASPTSVQYIYTSIRANMIVDNLQRAKDNLFYNIAGFVSWTGPCTSFYLFTLSSKLFRHELVRLFTRGRVAPQTSSTANTNTRNQNP